MSMNTNLHGRLRNTSLPVGHGLLCLFEAVVICSFMILAIER